ncbi:hypothetical protein BJX99DRAFT_241327 [Aspergillus californicus]
MNFDKQNNGHIAKPLTPTLSAAFTRASKSPLTPKLANPSIRAPKRLAPPSDHPASTPSKQGPEPPYLYANVTPRSGSRSSRRDGPVLSPGIAPTNGLHSPQSFVQASQVQGPSTRAYRPDRSPIRMAGKLEPARTTRAKTLTADLNTLPRPHSSSEIPTSSPRFFHASDARSASGSSDADTRSRVSTKSASPATFVYANGKEEAQSSEDTARRRSSGLSRPAVVARPTASPRIKSPQLNPSPGFSDNISQIAPQLDDFPDICSPMHSPPSSSVLPRPVPLISHTKATSLDMGRSTPQQTLKEGLRPSPFIISTADAADESIAPNPIPPLRPRILSNGSTTSLDSQNDGLQSPVKSDNAGSGPVLSARVERKILDLEISNSSLLAINKTLEREMRKQNAELRRFRRLSRSGRLSVAPSRSATGNLSITSEIDEGTSELSSNLSHDEMSDQSDEESLPDESSLGTESIVDDDGQQTARDEKRFFTDLAKHQDLLADSQKMNQSLKRCLGWTEELIKEAKKALEYNVQVSDIQLGGRVLSPDEMNEFEAGRGLLGTSVLSPDTELPDLELDLSLDEDSPTL